MPVVGLEAIRLHQRCERGRSVGFTDADHLTATPAHQMNMLVIGTRVIGRRAIGQMRVPDHAEIIEEFQGPIDRGEIDRLLGVSKLREDLLGSCVAEALNGGEDRGTLRGEAIAGLAQLLLPGTRSRYIRAPRSHSTSRMVGLIATSRFAHTRTN